MPGPAAPATPTGPLLLSVTRAAELLGISRSTLYQLVAAGRVPVVRLGRTARIPRRELERLATGIDSGRPKRPRPCSLTDSRPTRREPGIDLESARWPAGVPRPPSPDDQRRSTAMADTCRNREVGMAELTEQRAGEIQRGVMQVLLDHPDGLQAREVFKKLVALLPPTPFEAQDYPNRPGVRRYEKLVRFRTISLVKAGWLLKSAGVWSVTDLGRTAFSKYPDPLAFRKETNRLYAAWARSQPDAQPEATVESEEATAALEEAEEAAWSEIESYLRKMQPYDFQDLVAALLRAMGYHVSWVAPPGADGGMDIVAFTDPLGAKGPASRCR